jgi:hypothetical protein
MTERSSAHPEISKVPFFQDNLPTIQAIFRQLHNDFPGIRADALSLDNESRPTTESMDWMWTHFMGRQHGTMEGVENKVDLSSVDQSPYRSLISDLHYGPYGFADASPADPDTHYTASIVQGGLPQEISRRLQAGSGKDPRQGNVDHSIVLAGQRLRWGSVLGERSVPEIYETVAKHTGVDIDRLKEQSRWVRLEEAKKVIENDDWSGPFATEYEIARLCTEAYFQDLIDWKNYEPEVILDPNPSERSYEFRSSIQTVPPRTEALITYPLIDGRRASVLNAAAVPRPQGVPRPNSDSQTRELITLGLIGSQPETLNVAVSPPHIRAGIDTFIRL